MDRNDLDSHDKLDLIVFDSKTLNLGDRIRINPQGLENSARQKDGTVYFGKSNRNYPVDFELQDENLPLECHMVIKYDQETRTYLVKNIDQSNVYVKIDYKHILKHGSVILFGNNIILVKLRNEINRISGQIVSHVILSVIEGVNKGMEFMFCNTEVPVIKIGRKKTNDNNIGFLDDSTSRNQCT